MRLIHFQCLSQDHTWNALVIFFYLEILKLQEFLKNFSNKTVSLNEFSSFDKKSEVVEKKHSLTLLLLFLLMLDWLLDWHGKIYFNGMNESDQNPMPKFLASGDRKISNISKGYAALGQQHTAHSHDSMGRLQTDRVHWALRERSLS